MLMHRPVYHSGQGMNAHVAELNHAHYRGLVVPGRPCHPGKNHTALPGVQDWWHPSYEVTDPEKVVSVAEAAKAARLCASTNFLDKVRATDAPLESSVHSSSLQLALSFFKGGVLLTGSWQP